MNPKIAIASSDGKNIDLHFAQSYQYYIYEIRDNDYVLLEVRKIRAGFTHDENEFDRILTSLKDCIAIVVSRVGYGAVRYITQSGKRIFEAPYPIAAVLKKFLQKKILEETNRK